MPQQHLDRLSPLDASFLHQELEGSHMHVGGLTLFEGPPISHAQLLDQIRGRLHLVPRYRHKLAHTPLDRGRPLWVDDPGFDVEYHVRETVVAAPGGLAELQELTARVFSQRLERSRPLWELWLVRGVEGDGFAVISKTHHALVDGVGGVDLATVLLDLATQPQPPPPNGRAWRPQPEPGTVTLVAVGVRGALRAGRQLTAGAVHAVCRPDRAMRAGLHAAAGLGEVVRAVVSPAPPSPLNVPIGTTRRFVGVRADLQDFKLVKNAFSTTVNDVVLSVVTGALRTFLQSREIPTRGVALQALVPVSIRAPSAQLDLGNRLTAMRGPLPVGIADPAERLQFVKRAMDGLKESRQALAAQVLTNVENFAPPTVLAQASRLNFSTRLFNLLVTNIPGPQFPLYLLGRQLLDVFPVAFLPRNQALAVAIMSYNGRINFGLLGDCDALPDIDLLAEAVRDELAALVELARDGAAAVPGG